MKALSIRQPYINDIILGRKIYEFRNWQTSYRGTLLLCSSTIADTKEAKSFPLGMALCTADIVDITKSGNLSNYTYKWHLKNVRKIRSFPVKGKLMLFDVPDSGLTYL